MQSDKDTALSRLERLISIFCPLKPNDGNGVCLFGLSGFMLMFAYYLLRPVREALVLSEGNEEIRSYAVGLNAIVLLLLLPSFVRWSRARSGEEVFGGLLGIAIISLIGFFLAEAAGLSISVAFFIWLGVFSLVLVAQFWSAATDAYDVETGQRVFPAIAIGLSLGAGAGATAASLAFAHLGVDAMLLAAALVLGFVLATYRVICRRTRRKHGAAAKTPIAAATITDRGGFATVIADSYLCKIALLVFLLNWIDSGGDYILAHAVRSHVEESLTGSATMAERTAMIGNFYGAYFAWACLLGIMLQLLVVSRLFRRFNVGGALMVLPVFMVIGYGLLGFVPVFTIIYLVKLIEGATDYSIQATARHALFLPLDRDARHRGKTVIETFFWRCGDLAQALMVFIGLNSLNFSSSNFIIVNLVLAAIALATAVSIAREHACLTGAFKPKRPSRRLGWTSLSSIAVSLRYRLLDEQRKQQ
jgi:AAA family ATP:ADP antiporter